MTTKHQSGSATDAQPNNPLHGITLEALLNELVSRYGWEGLGRRIDIRCFNHEPGIASSLKFLRRTPWAREQVEALYLAGLRSARSKRAPGKTGSATIDRDGNLK